MACPVDVPRQPVRSSVDLRQLQERILQYKKESASPPTAGTSHEGLKRLLPMIDRHYYINLTTVLDRDTGKLSRGLWMYFPHSYRPRWPNSHAMSQQINAQLRTNVAQSLSLDEINIAFRDKPELHYDFYQVKFINRAISELNDIDYTPERLISRTKEYFEKRLSDLFAPGRQRPAEYPEFFYNFEKQNIYSDWEDHKRWVYFPIFFRHLWVSLLVARLPDGEELSEAAILLPLVSGVIAEKLLSVHASWGWVHPISAVNSEDEVISLMSIVAAQCGLYKLDRVSGTITFTADGSYHPESVTKIVRVSDGSRRFVFQLTSTSRKYFERIWSECEPTLNRFVEDISNRSTLAKASIMSRNFSHNVGSHTLANPALYRSLDIDGPGMARERLGIFHSYAQGRLDFMARAITIIRDRLEPLLFIGDVLNGFFRQGVLLNTLVDDIGFSADRLSFKVEIRENPKSVGAIDFQWDEKEHRYKRRNDALNNDVLVGLPGGSIACHALYAFLENCLRNAVKYGESRNVVERLIVTLRLEKCKSCGGQPGVDHHNVEDVWVLRISDNVSLDSECAVTSRIREHINVPLLTDRDGTLAAHGHGIQEMKVCAETLAGGENGLLFAADGETQSSECGERCQTCAEYQDYLRAAGGKVPSIYGRQALRCYSYRAIDQGKGILVYNLLFRCPVLLGIVTIGAQPTDNRDQESHDSVRRFRDLESLAHGGAHLVAIADSGQEGVIASTLKDICRLHPSLPFRLMVITPRPADWGSLLDKQGVDGFARSNDEPFACNRHIPSRRVRIVDASKGSQLELLEHLRGNRKIASFRYLGVGGWEGLVLSMYDTWLRSYQPLPDGVDSWRLCVGFRRDPGSIFGDGLLSGWGRFTEGWGKTESGSSCVSLYVKATIEKASANWPHERTTISQPSDLEWSSLLVFDNHGQLSPGFAKSWLREGPRFYQEMGLDVSLNLYQTMEAPPTTAFGFAFFIYSLVEAALTTVVVLDERVAQATVKDGLLLNSNRADPDAGGELRFQKAGIFPLLSFKRDCESWNSHQLADGEVRSGGNDGITTGSIPYGFLSKTILRAAYQISWNVYSQQWRDNYVNTWRNEGLFLVSDKCTAQCAYLTKEAEATTQRVEPDVLVVHEGVADALQNSGRWSADDVARLYECAPVVVRTSGRGYMSRHLGQWLPFVEFNEISANIYQSLNKVALAKSLLGTTGEETDHTQPS
jgi:hypothetical protein